MKESSSARVIVFLAGATILPALCAIALQFMAANELRASGQVPGTPEFDRIYGFVLSWFGVIGVPAFLVYVAVLGAVAGVTRSLNRLLLIEATVTGVTIVTVLSAGALGVWIAPPLLALLGWGWGGARLRSPRFRVTSNGQARNSPDRRDP